MRLVLLPGLDGTGLLFEPLCRELPATLLPTSRLIVPAMFYPAPLLAKLKAVVGRYSTPEIQALISRGLATVSPAVIAARIREVITTDATKELVACQVPILYLQAIHDYVVPASNLERIQALRPNVEVARVKRRT